MTFKYIYKIKLIFIFIGIILFLHIPGEVSAFEEDIKTFSSPQERYIETSVDSKYSQLFITLKPTTGKKLPQVNYAYAKDGKWSGWQPVNSKDAASEIHTDSSEFDHDDESDGASISETIDLKNINATKIKLDLSSDFKTVAEVKLFFVDVESDVKYSTANTFSIGGVNIVSRAGWGCPDNDPNSNYYCNGPFWKTTYNPITHIVFHHTATGNNSSDWADQVRAIWYYHSHVRDVAPNDGVQGWTDIGYNYLIDPNGVIYEGKYGGEGVTGGHVTDHNRGTVGIGLLGTYSDADITPAARASLVRFTETLLYRYKLDPTSSGADITGWVKPRVTGHRDWSSTACPGGAFYGTLSYLRDTTAYNPYKWRIAAQKVDKCPTGYTMFADQCRKYSVTSSWAGSGPIPTSLTVDKNSGNIYTASSTNNSVYKITPAGSMTFFANVGTSPSKVMVGNDGNIYTTNRSSNNITQIMPNGTTSVYSNTGSLPKSIVQDSDSNFYVINQNDDNVLKILPDLSQDVMGTTGRFPKEMAIDSNRTIYTSNTGADSVTMIKSDKTKSEINFPGVFPNDVEVDSTNKSYVLSTSTGEIYKKNSDNSFSKFATVDPRPETFIIAPNNILYTAHRDTNKVNKIMPTGEVDEFSGIGDKPMDIATSPDSLNIYTANNGHQNLSRISISANSIPLTTPIFRFWSEAYAAHFYTSNEQERNSVIDNNGKYVWMYENIAFYAHSNQVNSSYKPIHRFWSDTYKNHFYTVNNWEKDQIIANYPQHIWRYEGVAFYSPPNSTAGVVPVYRFWSDTKQSHFYTIQEWEKNNIIANDKSWTYEGIDFYAYK